MNELHQMPSFYMSLLPDEIGSKERIPLSSEEIEEWKSDRSLENGLSTAKSEWVLATGSQVHICNRKDLFKDVHAIPGLKFETIAGNGRINYIGDIMLATVDGKDIILRDVAFVPGSPQCILNPIAVSDLWFTYDTKGISIGINGSDFEFDVTRHGTLVYCDFQNHHKRQKQNIINYLI